MGKYGTEIQKAIAVQMQAEMAAKGWKQADLARAAGLGENTLSRYLKAGRDVPLPVFVDLCEALGLPIGELIARAKRRLNGENVL